MGLFRQLNLGAVTSALDDSKFIPLDLLDKLITLETITQSLRAGSKLVAYFWSDNLPRQIHQHARKVFTVLVLLGKEPTIQDLFADGLTDQDLPLFRKGDTDILLSKRTGREFTSFQSWEPARVQDFIDKQWLVQAPVMDEVGLEFKLEKVCPLPFLPGNEGKVRGGNTGVFVHQVRFHSAHCSEAFAAAAKGLVAVKEVQSERTSTKERDNLTLMKQFPHEHLIKPLAIIERDSIDEKESVSYFIFPWAHGGDLRQFWKRYNNDSQTALSPHLLLWALRQMLGISDGMKQMHVNGIRHGDIKPQNILHFIDPGDPDNPDPSKLGTLVLADVGVSKHHKDATNVRHWATKTNEVTISYEAPEAEYDQLHKKPRSRRYDMWSLGCMYLEFSVWLLYGFQAVEVFRSRRTSSKDDPTTAPGNFFTQRSPNSVTIHSKVTRALRHLRKDPRCGPETALGDLTKLIADRLLRIDPMDRAEAPELQQAVQAIFDRAEKDPEYLGQQLPSPPEIPPFFLRSTKNTSSTGQSRASFSSDRTDLSSRSSLMSHLSLKEENEDAVD
ncbi:kinase-like domain-containing protein [Podospora fimiseda]|uniref:Kinase-like domain-containing protein n=1 Tax=Podospora fimiseda TaxID=252190 RepID=A0AAN7BG99_9PEZI|nr:kinase-like domain-containing protein [Podospora fimiseda]